MFCSIGGRVHSTPRAEGGLRNSSQEQCRTLGGFKRELTDVWMLHDWVVPGWECTWGVFAPECPELGGTTGRSAWE